MNSHYTEYMLVV